MPQARGSAMFGRSSDSGRGAALMPLCMMQIQTPGACTPKGTLDCGVCPLSRIF